jgi:adenine-specific DNA methylase
VVTELTKEVTEISGQHAQVKGSTYVGDAQGYLDRELRDGDLLFCDPPYSEAQYSRFYHVLEGIYQGGWPAISGAGRAPDGQLRPTSLFSGKVSAQGAFEDLLKSAATRDCRMVVTYPEGERSNGLSVNDIVQMSRDSGFAVAEKRIPMRHSTLGGSSLHSSGRSGRKDLHEVVFVLRSPAGLTETIG